METAFAVAMEAGVVEPGVYEWEDQVAFLAATGRLSFDTIDVRGGDDDEDDGPDFSGNKLVRFFQAMRWAWNLRKEVGAAVEAGTSTARFELRREHLDLLASMWVRWQEPEDSRLILAAGGEVPAKLQELLDEETLYPVPAFDPKRPYGDMTWYYLDMAEALGIEAEGPEMDDGRRDFSEAQEHHLQALHEEMQMAVQVVLRHAELEPGVYERRDNERGGAQWTRVGPLEG